MSFILRIFFSGLIAFVPSEDGKELTVLLLDGVQAHQHVQAGGTEAAMAEHRPVLFARAGGCGGDCPRQNAAVASFFYPEVDTPAAAESLAHAVSGGAVWTLDGSNLRLGTAKDGVKLARATSARAKALPDTTTERNDFGWVAQLKAIDPCAGPLKPGLVDGVPPEGLVIARLQLTSGKVSTYSVIQVDGNVTPIDFRPLSGDAKKPYARAAASWVQAEIRVAGDSIRIDETSFGGAARRSMTLKPSNGVVELALLNTTRPMRDVRVEEPAPGTHFARYWDLTQNPPPPATRAVPQVSRVKMAVRDYNALHPHTRDRRSPLLEDLLFAGGRSPYDLILCPMMQYP